MRKKLFSIVLAATMIIAGCGAKVSDNEAGSSVNDSVSVRSSGATKDYDVSTVSAGDRDMNETRSSEADEPLVTDDDFEIWGYLYNKESAGSASYYLVVKNNSDIPVAITGTGYAKDGGGNVLDSSYIGFYTIGAGETQIDEMIFLFADGIESVEYTLEYDTNPLYTPILDDLNIQYNINYDRKNVTFSVTNNGDNYANITPYCIMFDEDDNVLWADYDLYFDSEINPGETVYEEMYIPNVDGYDHAEICFKGQGYDHKVYGILGADKAQVTDADFDINGYVYNYSTSWSGDTNTSYYLVVTNNSTETVSMAVNAVVKDADGNMLAADSSSSLDDGVVAPGETTICGLDFGNIEGYSDIEYIMNYYEVKYNSPVVGDLVTDMQRDGNNIALNVTNTGTKVGNYVKAYVLFFDEADNVVGVKSDNIIDSSGEIKPGATLTNTFICENEFERVDVYFKGKSW